MDKIITEPTQFNNLPLIDLSATINKCQSARIGNYIYFLPKIGSGSFSKVFLGRHINSKNNNEFVAIKRIKLTNVNKLNITRIQREIEILKSLNHSNIIKFLDSFVDIAQNIYIITEYCNYGNLSQFAFLKQLANPDNNKYINNKEIKNNLPQASDTVSTLQTNTVKLSKKLITHSTHELTHNEIKELMIQLRDGMKYLLEHNIIHRDIKPQNLLLHKSEDKVLLKIADFGFAKDCISLTENSIMQTLCGTPAYICPEMIKVRKYNLYSDLWSIGVILYQLFFHELPFPRPNNILDLAQAFDKMKLSFPHDIDTNAKELITQLLEIDPYKRIKWNNFFSHPWFDNGTILYNSTNELEDNYLDDKTNMNKLDEYNSIYAYDNNSAILDNKTQDLNNSMINYTKALFEQSSQNKQEEDPDAPYWSKLFYSPKIYDNHFPRITTSVPKDGHVLVRTPIYINPINSHNDIKMPIINTPELYPLSQPIPIPKNNKQNKQDRQNTISYGSYNSQTSNISASSTSSIASTSYLNQHSSSILNESEKLAKYIKRSVSSSIGSSINYLEHALNPLISKFSY